MKKYIMILLTALVGNFLQSQTISKPPIYSGDFSIEEITTGKIIFTYQDPDYKHIVKKVSFIVENKKEALFLMDEAVRILYMDKTDTEQNILHTVKGISIQRYGFNQDAIYLSDNKNRGYSLTELDLMIYRDALERYEYEVQINK